MSEAGQRLIAAAKEAASIARGEMKAARIHAHSPYRLIEAVMLQFVWFKASQGFALYTVKSGYGEALERARFGYLGLVVRRLEIRFRAPWCRAPRLLIFARL